MHGRRGLMELAMLPEPPLFGVHEKIYVKPGLQFRP